MTFVQAISSCFRNYATFSGRAVRSEFWYWYLFVAIVLAVFGGIDQWLYPGLSMGPFSFVNMAVVAACDGASGNSAVRASWSRREAVTRSTMRFVIAILPCNDFDAFHQRLRTIVGRRSAQTKLRKTLDTTGTFVPYVEAKQESAVFGSRREIGHQLYKEFGAGKLDGVIFRYNDPLYPGWVINSV